MKNPVFLSPPIFPPTVPSKPSLSTNRDDHLIPLLSQDHLTFKAQLTSLYMHPTDYTFRLYDKNQDFLTSIASKIMSPYQYWLDNGVKIFPLQFNFLRPSKYDLKIDESDPSFFQFLRKFLIIKHVLNFYNTQLHFRQLQIHFTIYNAKFIHKRPRSHNRIPS